MPSRVNIDQGKVEQVIDSKVRAGVHAAGKFLADQQKQTTRSGRLKKAVEFRTGRDSRGWYARAGMIGVTSSHPAFFWVFEEYRTGRGGGTPFIRQSLFNNKAEVRRMMTGRGGL